MTAGREERSWGSEDFVRPEGVEPDAILRVFRVPPEAEGMRCDLFIKNQLRNTSRTRARSIVENSAYSPSGRRLRPSDRLKGEARVLLWRPPFDEQAAPATLETLYEDAYLLVVDKPALMTVHPTARHHHHTVIKRLEAMRPGEFLTLIHRLDRETSGALMVARSPEADRAFKRVLEDRSVSMSRSLGGAPKRLERAPAVEKIYLAITRGTPEDRTISAPLEPDSDNPLRVKMRVASSEHGQSALTGVRVLDERAGYSLVECRLFTGRQHQIRVHLAHVGCPIVGDKLYGPDERLLARAADDCLSDHDRELLELPRHALHAHSYALAHPLTGKPLRLVSPLPVDLRQFYSSLKSRNRKGR